MYFIISYDESFGMPPVWKSAEGATPAGSYPKGHFAHICADLYSVPGQKATVEVVGVDSEWRVDIPSGRSFWIHLLSDDTYYEMTFDELSNLVEYVWKKDDKFTPHLAAADLCGTGLLKACVNYRGEVVFLPGDNPNGWKREDLKPNQM